MENNVAHRSEHLAALLAERLGIHAGTGFETKLAKAGRALPRWARRDGAVIVAAMALESHPKLAHRIERKPVDRAMRNLEQYLEKIDPFKRRMGRFLDFLAMLALIAIVVFGAIVTILVWRGLV